MYLSRVEGLRIYEVDETEREEERGRRQEKRELYRSNIEIARATVHFTNRERKGMEWAHILFPIPLKSAPSRLTFDRSGAFIIRDRRLNLQRRPDESFRRSPTSSPDYFDFPDQRGSCHQYTASEVTSINFTSILSHARNFTEQLKILLCISHISLHSAGSEITNV